MKALVSVLSVSLLIAACSSSPRQKPNIVVINVDDLGWMDLGYQGSEFYQTPNIDQLAAEGMVFTDGYSAASNCAPSRACLLTGLWGARHGIFTVGSSARGKSSDRKLVPVENITVLADEFVTIPEMLAKNGYTTCISGKWHLSETPEDHGFDVNIGGSRAGHPTSYIPPYGNIKLQPTGPSYLTNLIMDKTLDFVKSAQAPFFLYYAPYAVHTPIQGVEKLKAHYVNRQAWQKQHNIDYATMVENLDLNIGRLLSTLNETGSIDNTLIIFTSDNGGLYGITYQLPLRAGKGSYYEGGIRVPFFFVWKGKIQSGTENSYPISNLDLLPTILDAAGLASAGQEFDGTSLIPILTGTGGLEPRPLFWHFPVYLEAYDVNNNQNRDPLFRTRPGSVIRYGDWKLHQYFEDGGLELYHLKDDIGEQNNLAGQHQEKVNELLGRLNHWRNQLGAPVPDQINPEFQSVVMEK